MIFNQTVLEGAYVIEAEPTEDERGSFARTFCQREFEALGLNPRVSQCSTSFNGVRGTLRGMHFQAAPWCEAKLVRCTRGAIYDVIVDLRRDSSTFTQWSATELTADNRLAVYVPEGFAHGFLALSDAAEVLYQISQSFEPRAAQGVRWNDPAFGIQWPMAPTVISAKDSAYPDFAA